jgi:hypothetical protein
MHDLSRLTLGELNRAKQATAELLRIHAHSSAFDPETFTKIDTLHADITMTVEDHEAAERRGRIAAVAAHQQAS